MRSPIQSLLVLAAITLSLIPTVGASETLNQAFLTTVTDEWRTGKHRQYDFWLGEWEGRWRFRQEGEFFHSDVSLRLHHWLFPILNGKAIVELSLHDDPDPAQRVAGFSVRYFDAAKDRWVMAQDWPGWTSRGFVDQLQGFEREGRVQVFSSYYVNEKNLRTRRYSFTDIRDGYFRWDAASTGDAGRTWAEESIVEFHQTVATASLGSAGEPMPNVVSLQYCEEDPYDRILELEGVWAGEFKKGGEGEVRLVGARFNAGCAVMAMMSFPGQPAPAHFYAWTYVPENEVWMQLDLGGAPEDTHHLAVGESADDKTLAFSRDDKLVIEDEFEPMSFKNLRATGATMRTSWRLDGDKLRVRWEERTEDKWSVVREAELARISD